MCMYMCVHVMIHVWRLEDNLQEPVLSSHHVSPGHELGLSDLLASCSPMSRLAGSICLALDIDVLVSV